jgi:hypothetical protein
MIDLAVLMEPFLLYVKAYVGHGGEQHQAWSLDESSLSSLT